MAIIGVIFKNCPFQTFDLQLRFCLKFISKEKSLPSRNEMLQDTANDMNERWTVRKLSERSAHAFGDGWQDKYYDDLAKSADIMPIKLHVMRMYSENRRNQDRDFTTYRNYKFTIIDDENFEVKLMGA
jgi:hypothetical protein